MADVTQQQLDEMAEALRPYIAEFLKIPPADTTVAISCTPVVAEGAPAGAAIMRFDVRVRGEPLSADQDAKVRHFIQTSTSKALVVPKTPKK
jgi:hypothetical protein